MNIDELLTLLSESNVNLSAEGENIKIRAPEGILTKEIVNSITEHKKNLLLRLHQTKENDDSITLRFQPVRRKEELSLSLAQERIWKRNQVIDNNGVCNIIFAFSIEGPLNIAAIEKSLSEILQRHCILRTKIHKEGDQLIQTVSQDKTFSISYMDFLNMKEEEQSNDSQRLIEKETQRPFDLAGEFMLRCTLIRLGKEKYQLILAMHPIAFDNGSINIFFEELSELYNTFSTGRLPEIERSPNQYIDYFLKQHEQMEGSHIKGQINYWKKQLVGELKPLKLPGEDNKSEVQSFSANAQNFEISIELTEKIKSLSNEANTTSNIALLAVYAVLLSKYSNQEDLIICHPVDNRGDRELHSIIGPLANILALRIDSSGNPTFMELMERIREVYSDGLVNQDVPFEKIVSNLKRYKKSSDNTLAKVYFNLEEDPCSNLVLHKTKIIPIEKKLNLDNYDLSLHLAHNKNRIKGSLIYNSHLFNKDTASGIVMHFQTLLERAVNAPETKISEISILTETEKRQLLFKWNRQNSVSRKEDFIHELFEAQTELTPHAVAVESNSEQLTYFELNRLANKMAHYLRNNYGVTSEVLVGIHMEYSLDMIITIMAVLKAGGAFILFEVGHPGERLDLTLNKSMPSLLLTEEAFVTGLPESVQKVICLNRERESFSRESDHNLCNLNSLDNLAYVFYVSGESGRPCGVQILHRNLNNILKPVNRQINMSEQDTIFSSTPLSSDTAMLDIFLPLIKGARVILAEDNTGKVGDALLKGIEKYNVTLMQVNSSTCRNLLESGWRGGRTLKNTFVCETFPSELIKKMMENSIPLHNFLGSAEASLCPMVSPSEKNNSKNAYAEDLFRRSVTNIQVYVLDRYYQPLPVDVNGELYIGGDCLSRGYLNEPGLTAEKFIPDSLSGNSGKFLLKIGSSVTRLQDGTIRYLGPSDRQTNIDGLRIEMAEIEKVISQHHAVFHTVITLSRDNFGEAQIIAHALIDPEKKTSVSELYRYLEDKLPKKMIPSDIIMTDGMSMFSDSNVNFLDKGYVKPRTTVEEILTHIWSNVLGVDQVGINDNLFELGGNSLLAGQIVSAVQHVFKLEAPFLIVELFTKPTIAALSESLIKYEKKPGQIETIARIRKKVEQMSEEEVSAVLKNKNLK